MRAKTKVKRPVRPRTPKQPAFPRTAGAWWAQLAIYDAGINRCFVLMRAGASHAQTEAMRERPYDALSLWARRAVKRAYYAAKANHQRGVSA